MEIEISNLTKKYANLKAVDAINLTITTGVWGLLGSNGSGKTTLIRMICGILKQSEGEIFYDSKPIKALDKEYRTLIGYLPQNFGYYSEFRVIDYLEYIAALKGLSIAESQIKINEILNLLSLDDVRNKHIRKLSGGLKRRVGIAQALLNNPKILILDEPTAGLDPGERVRLKSIISELARDRIILVSTHIVSDVELIATTIAIMKAGKIVSLGSPQELTDSLKGKVWECNISGEELGQFSKNSYIIKLCKEGDGKMLVRYVSESKIVSNSFNQSPNLEDVYMWFFRDKEKVMESYL